MKRNVNLLEQFPQGSARRSQRTSVSDEDRRVSKLFGFDYFDGARQHGYGGYHYDSRFWMRVVEDVRSFYNLRDDAKVLDVGCAKGFMLYDLANLLPKSELVGVDLSEYALNHVRSHPRVSFVRANARELPFADSSFDLVLSINTLHNLPVGECANSIREVQRVTKGDSYIMVDGWTTELERQELEAWVLTAETVLSKDSWIQLFDDVGYRGDFGFWCLPGHDGNSDSRQQITQ